MSSPSGPTPPQPPPPQPARKSAFWWVLGVTVGLLAFLIGTGLYLAFHIARGVHVKGPNEVEIETPIGQVHVEKDVVTSTSLPIFPGARPSKEGARVVLTPPDEGEQVGIAAASYETDRPLEEVKAWYREHLGSSFREEKPRGHVRVEVDHRQFGHADVAFVSKEDGRARVVALARRAGGTTIELIEIGPRQPL